MIDVLVNVSNLKSNEVLFALLVSMVSVHTAMKCNERRLEVDVKRPKDRLNQRCFNTLDDGSNSPGTSLRPRIPSKQTNLATSSSLQSLSHLEVRPSS